MMGLEMKLRLIMLKLHMIQMQQVVEIQKLKLLM